MINRQAVLDKFDGHCAYCGKEITLKEMQVDHFISKELGGTLRFENLFPACRRCNFYKQYHLLHEFRELLITLSDRLLDMFQVKIASDYGMVVITKWDGVFYFEKIQKKQLTKDEVLGMMEEEMKIVKAGAK